MTIERPGSLKPVRERALAAVARAASNRTEGKRETGKPPRSGRRAHVLHGWRLLAGPLVVQILQSGYEVTAHMPPERVLRLYRKDPPPPAPRLSEMA